MSVEFTDYFIKDLYKPLIRKIVDWLKFEKIKKAPVIRNLINETTNNSFSINNITAESDHAIISSNKKTHSELDGCSNDLYKEVSFDTLIIYYKESIENLSEAKKTLI